MNLCGFTVIVVFDVLGCFIAGSYYSGRLFLLQEVSLELNEKEH